MYSFLLKLMDFGRYSQIAPKEAPSVPADAVMQTWAVFYFVSQL